MSVFFLFQLLEKVGCRKLVLQIGRGQEPIIPHNCPIEITWFRLKNGIREDIDNASLVISHAGAGSCTEVLAAKKPLIVVVNQDLMDNHQSELAEQLHCDGHVLVCYTETLCQTLHQLPSNQFLLFPAGQPKKFAALLDTLFDQ